MSSHVAVSVALSTKTVPAIPSSRFRGWRGIVDWVLACNSGLLVRVRVLGLGMKDGDGGQRDGMLVLGWEFRGFRGLCRGHDGCHLLIWERRHLLLFQEETRTRICYMDMDMGCVLESSIFQREGCFVLQRVGIPLVGMRVWIIVSFLLKGKEKRYFESAAPITQIDLRILFFSGDDRL